MSRRFRSDVTPATAIVAVVMLWAAPAHAQEYLAEPVDGFGRSVATGDFNGDGYRDLAIGLPLESIGYELSAGAIEVLYGTANGLTATNRRFFHPGADGVDGTAETFAYFGWSVAAGDFNGDGFSDLAVGAFWEDVGAVHDAGAVHVIYGSLTGLQTTAIPDQRWHQDSPGVAEVATRDDFFGFALAVGNFDGDAFDDLAISAPLQPVTTGRPGAVHVLRGSTAGLTGTGSAYFTRNGSIPSVATDEIFGYALAAGDFNGDLRDDLAVGASAGYSASATTKGSVNVLYGTANGLTTAGAQLWSQDSTGIAGTGAAGDRFGTSLATGDFNDDGCADLAIGVPGKDGVVVTPGGIQTVADVGAVNVIYGSETSGLQIVGNTAITQGAMGELAEAGDRFGEALASGHFNDDVFDDLAIGVPFEDVGTATDAGAIHVIYGFSGGLATQTTDAGPARQYFTEGANGLLGTAEREDTFGWALAAGDFNNDGYDELAVGIPAEDVVSAGATVEDAGAVNVIVGFARGLARAQFRNSVLDQVWTERFVASLPPTY